MGEISEGTEFPQLRSVPQLHRSSGACASLLGVQVLPVDPDLAVDSARTLADEREIALIDLRQSLVRRPAEADGCLQRVVVGSPPDDIGVADIAERAGS